MSQPPAPGMATERPRRGPRPLPLHLTLEMLKLASSAAASASLSGAWPIWRGERKVAAAALAQRLAALGASPADLAAAVTRRALEDHRALVAGINAYRTHPYRRDLPDPPTLWSEGGSRLLDYAPPPAVPAARARGRRRTAAAKAAPVALVVPSLVNRATVLDLAPGNSLMRYLAAEGVRPLLLDWGWPGPLERGFTLTDYIAGRIERALLAAAVAQGGARVALVGYCMGGNLAIAAAARRPDLAGSLALLATPWDFHAADRTGARRLAALLPLVEPVIAATGTLPVDLLQAFFAALDPFAIAAKFRTFAGLDPASPRAAAFVALEDWLNDGVPLAGPVARECLHDWYGRNTPGRGRWRVAGAAIDPAQVAMPTLVAVPARDRIVPPESAQPLARLIPGARLLDPHAGHIGMVAGSTAPKALWQPLRDWLRAARG